MTTYTDGLIMVGIGVILGGLGYFLYSKSAAASAATANALPEQVQTGVDSSGNPTYSYVAPSGIGVFVNQTPGPLGGGASSTAPQGQ